MQTFVSDHLVHATLLVHKITVRIIQFLLQI